MEPEVTATVIIADGLGEEWQRGQSQGAAHALVNSATRLCSKAWCGRSREDSAADLGLIPSIPSLSTGRCGSPKPVTEKCDVPATPLPILSVTGVGFGSGWHSILPLQLWLLRNIWNICHKGKQNCRARMPFCLLPPSASIYCVVALLGPTPSGLTQKQRGLLGAYRQGLDWSRRSGPACGG